MSRRYPKTRVVIDKNEGFKTEKIHAHRVGERRFGDPKQSAVKREIHLVKTRGNYGLTKAKRRRVKRWEMKHSGGMTQFTKDRLGRSPWKHQKIPGSQFKFRRIETMVRWKHSVQTLSHTEDSILRNEALHFDSKYLINLKSNEFGSLFRENSENTISIRFLSEIPMKLFFVFFSVFFVLRHKCIDRERFSGGLILKIGGCSNVHSKELQCCWSYGFILRAMCQDTFRPNWCG